MSDPSGVEQTSDDGVSRETKPVADAPLPSAEARDVFGDRFGVASQFVALLAGPGVERGLIGPRETPRLWDRHVLNCAALSAAVPHGARVADLGSGAGLPGLVLAVLRPDIEMVLVEPLLRRTTFLDEAVEHLQLANTRVRRARAEELHGSEIFDVVTARALAPLDRLLGWSMPLVAREGELVAMKGRSAADEVRVAGPLLARYQCGAPRVEVLTVPRGSSTATVVRVARRGGARVS